MTVYKFMSVAMSVSDVEGVFVCLSREHRVVRGNIFVCSDGGFVLFTATCDGISDCPNDRSDEELCHCSRSEDQSEHLCKETGHKKKVGCGPLYFLSGNGVCRPYTVPELFAKVKEEPVFVCNTTARKIDRRLVNDLVVDCGSEAEDANFKCDRSYCIPWSYVCDKKQDCPSGEDESGPSCGDTLVCKHMYKCKNTVEICIHVGNVCDSNRDCPHHDDKLHCQLKNVKCLLGCFCLGFAIECRHTTIHFDGKCFPYLSLTSDHLNGSHLQLDTLFSSLPNIRNLKLLRGNIAEVCSTKLPPHLILLDLSFNKLAHLEKNCIVSHGVIGKISFENNQIVFVESQSFFNLSKLFEVNLANNPLSNIPANLFKMCSTLRTLSFRDTKIKYIDTDAFCGLILDSVLTDDYHICCVTSPPTTCTGKRPWHKSCSDLIPTKELQIIFVVISITILLLNASSISAHLLTRTSNMAFSVTVVFINLSDVLCATYLCTVWLVDLADKDTFAAKEELWRSGPLCFTACGLVLCFSFMSQLVLLFLSTSRLMVVINPVDTEFKKTHFVICPLVFVFVLSVLVSGIVTFSVTVTTDALSTSLCLPFIDPTNQILMIEVITWFVAVMQCLTSTSILLMHLLLVRATIDSQRDIRISKSGEASKVVLVVQLCIITMSNILCWFPANGIYIAAMFLSSYPTELVTRSTAVAMPFNSVANPLVFLIFHAKNISRNETNTSRN